WPDCRNVRDLGGLPVKGGYRTRHRALVRADTLDRLTPDGVAAVRTYGVSRILDLRSDFDLTGTPHPFAADPSYRLVPFIDPVRDLERNAAAERSLADLYRGSVDRNGRQVAALVTAFVDAPPGTVVVHCLSGADRTGMLAAMLLDHIGVDRAAIAADYQLTQEYLGGGVTLPSADPLDLARRARPETILDTLDHIDAHYGGVTDYLRTRGVTVRQLEQVRRRLVE
ncbi:MAG TPA: tyrosine-protein phosphatase, partial [Mycobacteriales bacterium]|nr:tyrosine-protein phosphatase [Mycobacteriales bacterium]